ncbi:hypothetical protein CsatA_029114 [Cannabis sativa]
MGHTSARRKPAKGKSIRFGSAVSHECSDKNTDVRLQKRPKKSCTNHQRITQNSHISATRAQLESLGSDDNNDSELRDKEDDPDYCRFIKLKPDQPLDADCEHKDDGILYLKYLDVIEDDENTTPEKSDIVEEIQLGNEFDPKDESDDTCQDYPTFLDYLEKEGEENMFEDDDDDNVQILTTDENPRDVVNDTDLDEIESGEVAPTNLHSYNGPDFVL